jgi:hypothetical protein
VGEHQFGGSWTEDKLDRLRSYLMAYRTIFTQNQGRGTSQHGMSMPSPERGRGLRTHFHLKVTSSRMSTRIETQQNTAQGARELHWVSIIRSTAIYL